MRRVLAVSVLLHIAAVLALLLTRTPPMAAAIDPPRIEVLFGHESAPASSTAAAAASDAAARPPLPEAEGLSADPAGAAAATPAPTAEAAAADSAGLRVERPDPTMIPARDDPGNVAPSYPDAARRGHVEGTVLIRLHIDETGRVAWVEKRHSSGDASLDAAAETALAHWHFLPARRNGEPVASYRDQPVRFAIE